MIFSLHLISFGNDGNWLGPNYDGSTENFEIRVQKREKFFYEFQVGEGGHLHYLRKLLYFHDRIGTKERIVCIDKTTGKEKWNFFYESNYRDDFSMHNGQIHLSDRL